MRKTVLVIVLIILIVGLIFGVVCLTNPEMFANKKEESDDDWKNQVQLIKYPVLKGEIVHTYEIDAQALSGSPDVYIKEIILTEITDSNFSLSKNKGDTVVPNENFYNINGKEKSVDFNGLILDVLYERNDSGQSVIIKLLDYDAVYIMADIDMDKIEKISYSTPVKVIYDGQEYDAEINTIGYEIIDKKLPIAISSPIKIYPGTPVKVNFTLGVQNAGLYVPEDAIYQDGEDYFANIESKDGTTQIKLTVGQRFSVEEGGVTFEYVEILSGVSENDTLIVEQLDTSGSQIKENLKNE